MILCVNLNAAIDKTVIVTPFRVGEIHRPEDVTALPGGKGCNVARALQRLGVEPRVMGWVGGYAGQFIEHGLQQEGIDTDFIYSGSESRTCLSILDSTTQTMTEIYEEGEPLPPAKITEMAARFRAVVGQATAVTLSGSLPPGVPPDFYAQLIDMAHAANVPAFLDTSGAALQHGAAARPFLIKPNETEVEILAGRPLATPADLITAAADIAARYRTIVVLSLGKEGAIAAQDGQIIRIHTPVVEAVSAVGSGDCMLAGLAYAFSQGLPLVEAVKVGVAAGTANTLLIGAGQFRKQDFEAVYAQIQTS